MPNDLTKAEQAATEVLEQMAYTDFDDEARAVVAAVRPLIEAEMLDEIAMLVGNEPTALVQRNSIVTRLRQRATNRRRAAERQAEGSGQ